MRISRCRVTHRISRQSGMGVVDGTRAGICSLACPYINRMYGHFRSIFDAHKKYF